MSSHMDSCEPLLPTFISGWVTIDMFAQTSSTEDTRHASRQNTEEGRTFRTMQLFQDCARKLVSTKVEDLKGRLMSYFLRRPLSILSAWYEPGSESRQLCLH